ncbi:MAG: phosphohydrolase [Chloroflexi bacterium RBG_16_58_14]|nr:MAG: phosphohydrolase [Chloroflexi bacterium RBG_16_58_14]
MLNPGPWVRHSKHVASAAKAIAAQHPDLDPEAAYILGLLHDIGRRAGKTEMRHILDGYNFLHQQGYEEAAQICLTHSFPMKDVRVAAAKWDCSEEEYCFVVEYLATVEYRTYDALIQLCDCLALPDGYCLLEKRFVDVALRYGFNEHTLDKWKAYFELRDRFSREIGRSIYSVLPGVVENTFGFES